MKYSMWITLFDDQNDDEYDGAMGINDDEDPRVLVEMQVTEVLPPAPKEEEPLPQPESHPPISSEPIDPSPTKRPDSQARKNAPSA